MRVIPFIIFFISAPLFSAITIQDGKVLNAEFAPTMSVLDHYSNGVKAVEKNLWRIAYKHFKIIRTHFEDSPFSNDALFYLAICQYQLDDLLESNENLTEYLKTKDRLKHFEEAFAHKYAIGEKYRLGAKKHLFDWKKMPKWLPAYEEAIDLFDEVIIALPNHEITSKALYSKALLLTKMTEYREAIENYKMLIKRFPRGSTTPAAFLEIAKVYYKQSKTQFHNPDLLDLAQINLRKFSMDFPRDERVKEAKKYLAAMQEIHAKGLFETAKFYEKKKNLNASVIYYVTAIKQFPNTEVVSLCRDRLKELKPTAEELHVAENLIQ